MVMVSVGGCVGVASLETNEDDMKNNQHFVPQFYLRIFSGGERRIGLYGVDSGLLVPLASIKHQCYRHHFYGKNERIRKCF